MQTIIREATGNDVAALVSLWRELVELHAALDPQFRLVPDAVVQAKTHLRKELAKSKSLCLVAAQSSAIVGYCRASVRQPAPVFEQQAYGFVSELHVSCAFRRQGIGRKLFYEAQRWLVERGVRRLELMAVDANDASRAFWRSMGCEPKASLVGLTLRPPVGPE